MTTPSVSPVKITNISFSGTGGKAQAQQRTDDLLAVEEPLEISLIYGEEDSRKRRNISVTMCTPGNEEELAIGFLFTEGIIKKGNDILKTECSSLKGIDNKVVVHLDHGVGFDMDKLERHFYTSSSCGVCGKSSIEAVRVKSERKIENEIKVKIDAEVILSLPETLRKKQQVFEQTGGLHASALFDLKGNLVMLREDVGRHNALDKLIGAALAKDRIPLQEYILLLSGRASFELIQKATMAGIPVICAVGAPSSLAVEMAKECGITLIGFLRDQRFNIYSGEDLILTPPKNML